MSQIRVKWGHSHDESTIIFSLGIDNQSVSGIMGVVMAIQDQCDQCRDMVPMDTLILHRRNTWCPSCILEYIYMLEDAYYSEGGNVNDLAELLKKQVRGK